MYGSRTPGQTRSAPERVDRPGCVSAPNIDLVDCPYPVPLRRMAPPYDQDFRRYKGVLCERVTEVECGVSDETAPDPSRVTQCSPALTLMRMRFAQPKAMGRKVSDEYTVPLCSLHHRLLHQTGNEIAWWEYQKIDPMAVAAELWRQSRAAANRTIPSIRPMPMAVSERRWRLGPSAATCRRNRTRHTHPERPNQTAAAQAPQ